MNKSNLAKCLAAKLSMKPCTALSILDLLEEIMIEEFQQNKTIKFHGFGSFVPWEQAERPGRNPRTGDPYVIPARISVKFKPGVILLNRLNDKK